MKKRVAMAVLSLIMALAVTTSGTAAVSVAHGDISVFQGGQLVDKLSGQNPVDEGALLVCDGKCMIKSEGISLVAADQAKFAIQNEETVFNLYLRAGQLNYVITDSSRKIAFHTPDGSYSVAEVIFNAESAPVVKGYVRVTETGETEIAVSEGRLVFATADGMKMVDTNHKIVLAIAEVGTGTGAATGTATGTGAATGTGLSTGALVTGGVVLTGATVGGLVIANNNDDDPAPVVSPNN